jgi:dihydrofolate reductase
VSYQGFAAAWPSMTDKHGACRPDEQPPEFVVSTTLTQVEWSHSSLIKRDIAAEVRRLKQEPGRDILVADGALVRTQMQHDLVDEFRLMIAPVVLGSGKRLFEDGTDRFSG